MGLRSLANSSDTVFSLEPQAPQGITRTAEGHKETAVNNSKIPGSPEARNRLEPPRPTRSGQKRRGRCKIAFLCNSIDASKVMKSTSEEQMQLVLHYIGKYNYIAWNLSI